ncbi:MAG: isoaspartyl peptidase/L-asparaginase [Gammaproteobacteria bacterium]|nr:isoaspartyl peptidase/L-asparaginase [Gammaproteobacteria bacterium]
MQPLLIIHGGMGSREGDHALFEEYAEHLRRIVKDSYEILQSGTAQEAVRAAVRKLEDDAIFNAGTGSRLQRDGEARMSAAIMDTKQNIFAGVMNIQKVRNPIEVAARLVEEPHHVLAGLEATAYARSIGVPEYDPVTVHRLREHKQKEKGSKGTVGAVAIDAHGVICAGTSTGGVGYEIPGRVSDSATVAGNYARKGIGVSCTGIGEDIVNHAAAARLAVRAGYGGSLIQAAESVIAEAAVDGFEYGFIAVNQNGDWVAEQTHEVTTLFAVYDGKIKTFLG